METSVATQYTKIRPNETNIQSKNSKFNGVGKPRSLKDRLEKEYSFPKEVVEDFFKGLTEMKLIQLPEPRQVNENTKRHDDGRYCKYHRMPGHTLEECFVFKDKVQEMIDDGTIDPALLKNFKKERQSANMVSISQVDEEALPKCMDTLTLSSYAVPYIPPSYRPMEDSSSPGTPSKVPHHVVHMKELRSPSTPPTIMKKKKRTPTPFPILTYSVKQSPPSHLKKRLFAEDTKSSRVMPVLIPRQGSTLPEIPLPTTDDEDSMSEPEQLYTNQGKPYVSKKQKKSQAFKERVEAARNNPISTKASRPPLPKKKRTPKYKILSKVMPKEEIERFITRVSRELYINKPRVVDNDTPWADDLHCNTVGVVEGDDGPLCFPEETSEANITTRSGIQTKEIRPPPVEYIIPRKEKAQPHDNVTLNVAGPSETVKYNVLAHLKKIPSLLSVYDALCLSSDLRKAFVTAMQFPDDYRVEVANVDINPLEVLNIEFTDEDLLLGSKLHNRPLLVTGDLEDTPINRIMLDCGSAVNLIPLRTLTRLGYTIRNLTRSNIVIQGFNQTGQQALGTMRLTLRFQGWISTPLFHVIDAFTSYNALLGRPWLHEYGVISSSLHQCFKYKTPEGEIRRVFADTQPFTTAEAFYADAKFYFEGVVAKEIKGLDFRVNKVNPKKVTTHNGGNLKKVIYRYIPREQRKDGDPVFQILEDEVLNSNQGKEFSGQKKKNTICSLCTSLFYK